MPLNLTGREYPVKNSNGPDEDKPNDSDTMAILPVIPESILGDGTSSSSVQEKGNPCSKYTFTLWVSCRMLDCFFMPRLQQWLIAALSFLPFTS